MSNPHTRAAAAEFVGARVISPGAREPGADAFGQRTIADLAGEAMRRTFLGAIRPLWHDLDETDKAAWRHIGIRAISDYVREQNHYRKDAARKAKTKRKKR
jgi:hypothetical protein